MPSTAPRSRDPRPNVLADGVEPNRLSTQAYGGTQGAPRRPAPPTPTRATNQFVVANPATRTAAPADPRFETRARRGPSLVTIVVIGFLLVTLFRVIASLAGH
ncbi:MAG TPA: hypothetical protein VE011_00680 [Candidatus Dormibacteraeota bacterium]|nr:hypothetical protein [Candidatus Dormibacteraeota bacterium]